MNTENTAAISPAQKLEDLRHMDEKTALAVIKSLREESTLNANTVLAKLSEFHHQLWSEPYLVAEALFELAWQRRQKGAELRTAGQMLDTLMTPNVILMLGGDILDWADSPLNALPKELSAEDRVRLALHVLDEGAVILERGGIDAGGSKFGFDEFLFIVYNLLSNDHQVLDYDFGADDGREGAFEVLLACVDMFTAGHRPHQRVDPTLEQIAHSIELIFDIKAAPLK